MKGSACLVCSACNCHLRVLHFFLPAAALPRFATGLAGGSSSLADSSPPDSGSLSELLTAGLAFPFLAAPALPLAGAFLPPDTDLGASAAPSAPEAASDFAAALLAGVGLSVPGLAGEAAPEASGELGWSGEATLAFLRLGAASSGSGGGCCLLKAAISPLGTLKASAKAARGPSGKSSSPCRAQRQGGDVKSGEEDPGVWVCTMVPLGWHLHVTHIWSGRLDHFLGVHAPCRPWCAL